MVQLAQKRYTFEVPPKGSITLDASKTTDRDHPEDISQLVFEWSYYLEPGSPQATGNKKMAEYVRIESLSPLPGTDGRLAVNKAGFGNVALGHKVSVTNLMLDEVDLRLRDWYIIL
ncbi:hypothetical protein ACHAPT_010209 [Fusarium lateritium]